MPTLTPSLGVRRERSQALVPSFPGGASERNCTHRKLWFSRRAAAGRQACMSWGATGQPTGPLFMPELLKPGRPYPRAPSLFEEAAGTQGHVPRGPGAHLSISPQAEISHMAFQPGHCTQALLPPQQQPPAPPPQPCLAPCLGLEHKGGPWGVGASSAQARTLADSGPL